MARSRPTGGANAPYVPHVTVATHALLAECRRIAGELNAEYRVVSARIETLDVIVVGDALVRTVAKIRLGRHVARKGDAYRS